MPLNQIVTLVLFIASIQQSRRYNQVQLPLFFFLKKTINNYQNEQRLN